MTNDPRNPNDPKKKPGDDPHEVQKEAKRLRPNEEARTQEERDNPLEREFEGEDQRELDSRERQHRPLTDAEDNAQVDRLIDDTGDDTGAAPRGARAGGARMGGAHAGRDKVFVRPTSAGARTGPAPRAYLASAETLRNLFIASGIIGTLLVVVILTLASATDSARYTPADETQYQRTLAEATETISGFAEAEEDGGSARIPIDQAMTVMASQGLEAINASLAAPAEPEIAEDEADPQDAVVAPDDEAEQAAQQETDDDTQAEAEGADEAADEDTTEDITEDTAEMPTGEAIEVLSAGQAAYEANCASCHQATGQGVPGAFPPVAGHAAALYNAESGRPYLINLLLYGLQGEIEVEGQTYNGVMPPWQQLPDGDIADILNYIVTAWEGNEQLQDFTPYEADEIAELRAETLTGADVYALRQELGLTGDE